MKRLIFAFSLVLLFSISTPALAGGNRGFGGNFGAGNGCGVNSGFGNRGGNFGVGAVIVRQPNVIVQAAPARRGVFGRVLGSRSRTVTRSRSVVR